MDRDASTKCLNLLPLGIPTIIIADDPQLIAAARAAYVHWSAKGACFEPRVQIRLDTGNASSDEVSLSIEVEGSRLRLRGPTAQGVADAATGNACGILSAELLNDPAAFAEVTDTLLLFLLARSGRTPVHASAFMLGGRAVVLAGRSGSGKSTLALAAASRGLPTLSDDTVFVQRDPRFALWGFPRPIHVFAEDAPEGEHAARLRNAKLKVALPIAVPALKADRCLLVLLEEGTKLALDPIDQSEALDVMMNLDAGFDLLADDSRAAIQALAASGVWRLILSADPRAAVDLLVSRFGES